MKREIPILFSTPMIQAILEGRKTQTRRIIKPQPDEDGVDYMENPPVLDWEQIYKDVWKPWIWDTEEGERKHVFCPYGQPGDVIWVRESFTIIGTDIIRGSDGEVIEETSKYVFRGQKQKHIEELYKWKPSIHMPKAAARIWLEVVSVKVERLQDITNVDAVKEGINSEYFSSLNENTGGRLYWNYHANNYLTKCPTSSFQTLWESINGKDSWHLNPWVWVIEFKRINNQ